MVKEQIKTRLMVTLPREIAYKVREQAEAENRSISNMVQTILLDYYHYREEEEEMVRNADGRKINYDAAVNLMDDDLREEIHAEIAPCSNQKFFDTYVERHREKFGESFCVD